MMITELLRKFFPGKDALPEEAVESLRLEFKVRYHSFKMLIRANNKALESMADIEQTLASKDPFGMSFIRSHVTAIAVSIFSMITHLKTIAPGKYDALDDSFAAIQKEIEPLLSSRKTIEDPRLVIPFCDIGPSIAGLVGQKMANVADVKNRLDLHVPNGFVITAAAYELMESA